MFEDPNPELDFKRSMARRSSACFGSQKHRQTLPLGRSMGAREKGQRERVERRDHVDKDAQVECTSKGPKKGEE